MAGLLSLRFGNRMTQWKKGWTGEARDKHPNTLLAVESIEWAEKTGAALVDFAGGNRTFVRSLLSGSPSSGDQRASRDFYLVGLGAEPALLPAAMVRIRHPLARFGYSVALRIPAVKRKIER